MSSRALRGRLRPTRQQRLLLQCALGDDDTVRSAWAAARAQMDFDDLDEGSHGVLPLVYVALARAGVADPLLGRLKGIYRKAWFANQLLLDAARQPLGMLRHAGDEPLLLHDTALMAGYYPETAMRRVAFLDVAVRPGTEEDGVRALLRSGWRRHPEGDGSFPAPLLDDAGRLLFLHAGLPEAMRVPHLPDGGQDAVWARSRAVERLEGDLRVLDATDQLLSACAVGPDLALTTQALWLADVATIARHHDVDWDALAVRASERRVTGRVRGALGYLVRELGVELPAGAIPPAAGQSRRDALAYSLYSRGGGRLGGLPQTLARHVRQSADESPVRALAGTARFLGDTWGVDTPGQLPKVVLRKAQLRQRSASSRGS